MTAFLFMVRRLANDQSLTNVLQGKPLIIGRGASALLRWPCLALPGVPPLLAFIAPTSRIGA